MTAFVSAADVRGYMNVTSTSGQYSDGNLGSNIRVASSLLQQLTNRQFEAQTGIKYFSTMGRSSLALPDLRSVNSVTLNTATLTQNSSFYLIPDRINSGVYVGIEIPAIRLRAEYGGGYSYKAAPDWWDRNMDSPKWQAWGWSALPNDLAIDSDQWGWAAADYPEELLHATKVLAAWFTVRPDSVFSNVIQTPGGTLADVSQYPPEVQMFVGQYRLEDSAVSAL